METAVVALCVLAALVYVGRTMYLRMTRKSGGCGCGCSGCGGKPPAREGTSDAVSPFEKPACCGEHRP